MTTASEFMAELFGAQSRGVHGELDEVADDLLNWQPDSQANSIAVTVWHFSRVADLVVNSVFHGKPADDQFWFTGGYAEKYDYNPLGKGANGWGALTGFSIEEMQAIPKISGDDLLNYFDMTFGALQEHIEGMSEAEFDAPISGAGAERSAYYWSRIVIIDATRHMGEISAIKAMYRRKFNPIDAAG
ncbi:MAG: DinB family protein [Aggregatilineales bacterium]